MLSCWYTSTAMAPLQVLVVVITSVILCSGNKEAEILEAAKIEVEALRAILSLEKLRHKWNKIEFSHDKPLAKTQSQLKSITDGIQLGVQELLKLAGGDDLCVYMGKQLTVSTGILTKNGGVFELAAKSGQTINLGDVLPAIGLNLKIQSVNFDCSTYRLIIETLPTGTTTVIENFMTLDQIMVAVDVVLKDVKNSLAISINGNWNIGTLTVNVSLSYTTSNGNTIIRATPSPQTSVTNFIKSVTGLSLPINPSVNFGFSFAGQTAKNGFTTLTLSSDQGTNKFYAVYQKQSSDAPSATGMAVEVQRIIFSTIIRQVINLDISSVPYFGAISVNNLGLSFGTNEVIELQDAFKGSILFQRTQYKINKGLTAYISVPFHDEPLTVTYTNKVLVLSTPSKPLSLNKLLEYLISSAQKSKLTFPSKIPSPFKLSIDVIKISKTEVIVSVGYSTSIVFFDNILVLSDVALTLTVSKKKPKVKAAFSGSINFAGIKFNARLSHDENNKYTLSADGFNLDITKVISAVNAEVLPRTISNFLRKIPFLNFSIRQATLMYNIGTQRLQIGGTPTIQGFEVVTLEANIVKIGGKSKLILGFELGKFNFANLLKTITGFDFGVFSLLKQSITSAVSISPITTNSLQFTTAKLVTLPIRKGVSIVGSMQFPSNCGSDVFCKFAGILVGKNAVFNLEATISSATYFPIRASLQNLQLGSGIVLGKAGIEIVGGTSSQIGLVGEVQLNSPPLIFSARISAGTKGLSMELSMANCWVRAFGAKWLNICNLLGSIDFAPPTGITGLAVGAEIHLGYNSTGHQIKGKGYIGVSIIAPIENYYYVSFTRVTIGSLLKAFKINQNIPKPLAESGFPRDFLSSYSSAGKELPQVHVSIPAGFRLKGALNILGLQGSADITINLPKSIDVKVALPPIKVGSILAMYMSSRNKNKGPTLMAKVQLLPKFKVNIEASGYVQVLGISIEAKLKITNTQYQYFVSGKVLNLFEASMSIIANYGSINRAHFQVKGEFKSDLFNKIKQSALSLFSSSSNEAKKQYDKAKKEVERIEKLLKSAKNEAEKAWKKVKSLGGKITTQSINCSNTERCKKVYSQGLTRAVRRVTRTVRRGIRKAAKLLDKVKEAYNKAKDKVNGFKNDLKKVKAKLVNIKKTFRVGLKFLDYIRKRGLQAIMYIKRVWFDVSLQSANGGVFSGGVEMYFLGNLKLNPKISFNLHKIADFAKKLFELVKNKII